MTAKHEISEAPQPDAHASPDPTMTVDSDGPLHRRLAAPDAAGDPRRVPAVSSDEDEDEGVDPFCHRIHMTKLQWARTLLLSVTLLPLRLVLLAGVILLSWLGCTLALLGLSQEERQARPLSGWRKFVGKDLMTYCGQLALRCCGFQSITVKGRQASSEEAPILVAAPHSTFFDGFVTFWSGLPYLVSREENKHIPLIGTCIECAQALFVSREDPQSRQKTIKKIIERANCTGERKWPQLLIFAEGSTSNRQALMTFKPGAFYPGRSVQPVVLRFPNLVDTVTWTWNQPHGVLTIAWLTLAQPCVRLEFEYLPVYHPSEEEKQDAKLFASNVRKVMAAALGVPTSDVTYEQAKARYGKKSKKKRA